LGWGLWRFSPSARYRLKREVSHSPYAGMRYWHHYAGLVVGLTTFTWIFSGLLSMDPWDRSRANSPTRQQADAVSGGPLRLDLITLPRLKAGVAELERLFTPKEIEVVQFRSEPFLLAYRPPSDQVPHEWRNT